MSETPVILVPLDGSDASKSAWPAAQQIAAALGDARIDVVYVGDEAAIDEAALLLAKLQMSRAELAGGRAIQRTGDIATAITRTASEERASLIVMSGQGRDAHCNGRLGSTAAAIIQQATCPVLVVRPDMSDDRRTLGRLDHVLVPLDGSPAAAAAVPVSTAIGRHRVADLDLLHVATAGAGHPSDAGTLLGPRYLDAPHHEWPAWTHEFLRRFGPTRRTATGGHVRVHAAQGDPGDEIVRFAAAHDTDLIGLAWQQVLEPGRADVIKHLLNVSPCPLLFVPAVGEPVIDQERAHS